MIKILLATSLLFVLASCGMTQDALETNTTSDTTSPPMMSGTKNYEDTLETASSKIK